MAQPAAEEGPTSAAQAQVPPPKEDPSEQEDKSIEAIKFIKEKLQTSFDEQSARRLFEYYTLDKNTQRLQPSDVRKLLLDILSASEWPLVVPDESLDSVLHELCLNDEGSITWIEFKSFFVFLQDKPIMKLFSILTKLLDQKQLNFARLITIKPARSIEHDQKLKKRRESNAQQSNINNDNNNPVDEADEQANNNNNDNDNNVNDDIKKEECRGDDHVMSANYYDRSRWNNAVAQLIPEAKQIFIYFRDGHQVLALVLGDFDSVLEEVLAAEITLENHIYLCAITAFDCSYMVFPPIQRSGGMKSKVARRIADSYLLAKEWDANNLKLAEKAGKITQSVSVKWREIDEKYKVQEKLTDVSTQIFSAIKGVDERYQLTRRLSNSAKQFDDKYKVTSQLNAAVSSVAENEKVKSVTTKVTETVSSTFKVMNDINQETKQVIQEKQQKKVANNNNNNDSNENENKNQEVKSNNEGVIKANVNQEYGGDDVNDNANANNENANESVVASAPPLQ